MPPCELKICTKCARRLPLDDFYWRKDAQRHKNQCKVCVREQNNGYRRENAEQLRAARQIQAREIQQRIRTAKAIPCVDCGETYPYYVMDFHHREGEQKDFNIAEALGNGYSLTRVLGEIAKCDLLCANCHRLRHGPPYWVRYWAAA